MHILTQRFNPKGYPSASQPDRLSETAAARGLEVLAVEVVCCQLLQSGAGRAQLAERDMPSKTAQDQQPSGPAGQCWGILGLHNAFSSVVKKNTFEYVINWTQAYIYAWLDFNTVFVRLALRTKPQHFV